MGQRGSGAVFMPSKYVFPGGGVDEADDSAGLAERHLSPDCRARLVLRLPETGAPGPDALVGAALRELDEETGLGLDPAAQLHFIFRAITPAGSPRRFDARFFLAPADAAQGDMAEFSRASGELSHLHWINLHDARALDLPFITEVVLAETGARLRGHMPEGVPFFDNSGPEPRFRRLIG